MLGTAVPPSTEKPAVIPVTPALKTYIVMPDPRIASERSIVAMHRGYVPVKGIWI